LLSIQYRENIGKPFHLFESDIDVVLVVPTDIHLTIHLSAPRIMTRHVIATAIATADAADSRKDWTMNAAQQNAVNKSHAIVHQAYPKERAIFRTLLQANPNYFGNLRESMYIPVVSISSNTYYEELGALGYDPQHKLLEAVVYIHQPSGYDTDTNKPDSLEYVRFYLSIDNGASWQDMGMTYFQAKTPSTARRGGKRLAYTVSLPVDPKRAPCPLERLIQVRAILSWNNPPPANQPDWMPVWGNAREASIRLDREASAIPFRASRRPLKENFGAVVHTTSLLADA